MTRTLSSVAVVLLLIVSACANAAPVRPADGHSDPNDPSINCDVNTTIDCRPAR
jgi:hypothetical protein